MINFPYVDSVSDETLLSKNQSSIGPVIIKIPKEIIIIPENLGIKLIVILSLTFASNFVIDGKITNPKKITPPIQIDESKLCT